MESRRPTTESFRLAAVILLRIESAIIGGLVIYLGIAAATSRISKPSALAGVIIFGILGSAGLYVASTGFAKGLAYGRSPAVLANGIALGVSYFMAQGHLIAVAIPLAILAAGTLVCSLFGYSE
jgi:hypothetical protein